MNTLSLTDTQTFVLRDAAVHPEQRIESFPKHVKGGARDRVLQALLSRGLIRAEDNHHVLTDAGFSAIGLGRPAPLAPDEVAALEPTIDALEASWGGPAQPSEPTRPHRLRAGTKQAALIELLIRSQGASIAQLVEALGWQAHSVRGALVTVPRKWGYSLRCEKVDGVRRYHVQTEAAAE